MKSAKKRKFKKRYILAAVLFALLALVAYDFISFRYLSRNVSVAEIQQGCTCESNFEWVRKTFEENDAGFSHILDIKGQEAYDIHNQLILERIRNAENFSECVGIMRDWLRFFRSGHIGIYPIINEPETTQDIAQQTEETTVLETFEDEFFEKIMKTRKPFLKELNETTLYLRIPTFVFDQRNVIDSVIFANREKILNTKNLIIDLRNNGGGADRNWRELLTFLYTNPIYTMGVEFLSTELNNREVYYFATSKEIHFLERMIYRWMYRRLQRNLGEFVNLRPGNSRVSTRTLETIHPYPQNVGIIVDRGVGSAAEQFLLAAQQSTKVTVFGTNTLGTLDISNIVGATSPCNELTLIYGISRSMRIPEMVIDEIGIAPDYHIDESVPRHKWVEYVNEILNR